MKLEINGEEIAFELENEKTLEDVVRSIATHLQDHGFVGLEIMADGEKLSFEDDSWKGKQIKDVQRLQVNGQMAYDFDQCIKILLLAKEAFDGENLEDIGKILAFWPRFMISLRFWLSDFHLGEGYFSTIGNLPNLVSQFLEKSELKVQILRILDLSTQALEEKGRELENPKSEVLVAISRLQDFRDPLTSLAVLFQNGKDAKAMQDILIFMELFQKLMRTVNFLPASYQSMREKTAEIAQGFSGKMKEFTQACEVKDYVLAADLAEYEIVPQLDALDQLRVLLEQPSE